jgi:hypothetical protein
VDSEMGQEPHLALQKRLLGVRLKARHPAATVASVLDDDDQPLSAGGPAEHCLDQGRT